MGVLLRLVVLMIEHKDIAARKQVLVGLMTSLAAGDKPQAYDAPTIIQPRGRGLPTGGADMHTGFLACFRQRPSRWFWVAEGCARTQALSWRVYGFAETEQQAMTDAAATINEDLPTGFRFRVLGRSFAADIYAENLATRSWFAQDWRTRFPFWAERTHLYKYSEGEGTLRIVAVTDKSVFVYYPPFVPKEQVHTLDVQKVPRRDCITFDRETLERDGEAYHRRVFKICYVEPQQFAQHDHNQTTRPRIEDLRRVMQKEHPDRGGDVELFRAAQEEYRQLKHTAKRGAA